MKTRLLTLILISAFATNAAAQQTEPDWYDSSMREMSYPAGEYFTGYTEVERRGTESLEAAVKRAQDAARVEAAGSIRVHVKNTSLNQGLSQTLKTMEGTFRQSVREFSSATETKVDIKIPGLKTDIYHAPNGTIAAFAWVKKSTLVRQLEKQITVGLTKAETSLDQIDQLAQNGQKMQAREIAEKVLPQFDEIDEYQKLLAAVDEDADEETLQLELTRNLQQRLIKVAAELKNGINVYVVCDALMFTAKYNSLKSEITGALSDMGCSFVNSADKSDWAIYVTAVAREYNAFTTGSVTTYFAYVDAKIIVEKTTTGQRIFEDTLSQKGGHTHNYEQAARDAYRQLSPQICSIVKEQIRE